MLSVITLALSSGGDTATLTLKDVLSLDNTQTCSPRGFLAAASGKWTQGLGSLPVEMTAGGGNIMSIMGLNTTAHQSGKRARRSTVPTVEPWARVRPWTGRCWPSLR